MNDYHEKKRKLEDSIKQMGSVLVAFSSGVDSTFLLKVAHGVLGEKAVAVTARADIYPIRETKEAESFCQKEGIRQIFVDFDALSVEGFCENPKNRCYLCKRTLFQTFGKIAQENGIPYILEGSNLDDEGDYRPGMLAVKELGIQSPLREARLTKAEIRLLSREMGLPTWSKPSCACLASRFAYGEKIDETKLARVAQAEQLLLDLGFSQVRVRVHGDIARIEITEEAFEVLLQPEMRRKIHNALTKLGFLYVTLDLGGYQMGSMNKMLK